MLNVDKKKVFTLFALTLLVTSLILVGINLRTGALPTDDLLYLDGPSLTPIHMHGPSLMPIHMHAPYIIDLTDPWGIEFHELYPDYCEIWNFTSWEDTEEFGVLDPSDQIDMTNLATQEVRWFHVDRVTMTMLLWTDYYGFDEWIYVEFKGPYTPYIQPICTNWTEIWPVYLGIYGPGHPYHIINWDDTGIGNTGYLGVCDWVYFEDWPFVPWHVEEYSTDLILNEKIMDPIGIEWHELYPTFCNWHNLTSWNETIEDPYPGRLSPGDQIDMWNYTSQETKWYYVDRVTFTMLVSNETNPEDWMYIEYKGPFETMYNIKTTVINSTWHEVWPFYSASMNITSWIDNCNGVLDYCDWIELHDLYADIYYGWWHVEELSIDIILNEKIDDPTGIIWHELYPDCCIYDYETLGWEDNGDGLLNPCDNITLAQYPTGLTEEYHVENMTLTLNLTIEDMTGTPPFTLYDRIYIEYLDAYYYGWEWLYYPKTHPLYTDWEVVCPTGQFGYRLTIENWYDNCNGVLSYCDILEISCPDGALWVHVDEVAIDITVKKITEEPPPPPKWYKKPPYPDYAPSGMPDFDQKQDIWGPAPGWFTWCGPTAVANSLWWFDSKYDPSNILTAYPGVPDDHSVLNVDPFIRDLAWFMDTDGQRTGSMHTGTFWMDMVWGIDQYLIQQGANDTLEVHFMEFPEFDWVEMEIMRCQDVVLLLEFWIEVDPGFWVQADPYDFPGGDGGHYVTCAGVNSTTFQLLLSDPFFDAAEAGWPGEVPVTHPAHADPTVHNDTQYVSHDAYNVILPMSAPYPAWELVNYLQQNMQMPPNYHTFIRVAIATSPLAEEDVAVTNVTTIKDGCVTDFPTVSRGHTAEVNVTVQNQDTGPATFTVTAYANMTSNGNMTAIGAILVVNLPSGDNATLTFTWNTATFAYGNYTIVGYASILPTETDTADNWFTGSKVMITGPGDISGDMKVGPYDFAILAVAYGSTPWQPGPVGAWNPNADMSNNKKVDPADFAILAANYGNSYP